MEQKLSYLESEIDARTASFSRSRDWYRRRAHLHTLANAVLSTLTTASIAMAKLYNWDHLLTLSILSGAALTVLATIDGLHSYRAMWIRNTTTLMRLYDIKSDISYLKAGATDGIPEKQVDALHNRYKRILEEANSGWEDVRKGAVADK